MAPTSGVLACVSWLPEVQACDAQCSKEGIAEHFSRLVQPGKTDTKPRWILLVRPGGV